MSSSEYHPALSSVTWLFGVWESIEAEVYFPARDTIKYDEVLEFKPTVDEPILDYKSDTWDSGTKKELHRERGYLRVDPESNKVAMNFAHHFGATEIAEGTVQDETVTVECKSFPIISFVKCDFPRQFIRKYYLDGDELCLTAHLETEQKPLHLHLKSRFRRKK